MSDLTPDKAQALLAGATTGTWRLCPDTEFDAPAQQIVASGLDVATLWGGYLKGDGDAALIAAAPDLARAYIAQAAELTRLRARVEAADKLAEAGSAMIDFHNGPAEAKRPDIWQRLLQRFAAALSAYEARK